jgi:RHS repeat-associated protein
MTVTYRYDGLGRRIEKNVNGVITRYVYDKEDILSEFNGSNSLIAKYTHGVGIDEPLIMERGGLSHFYQMDGLGSITELSDSSGSVAQSYIYDSFGQIVNQSGSLTNLYTYTGRELDPESGLYYYRARYYNSSIGRFLRIDPVPGAIAMPQSLNPYPYVQNNPLNFIDPFGLTPECREKAWEFFRYCLKRGGIATGFTTGHYVAACAAMTVFGGGGAVIPCVAAVGRIGTLVGVVTGAICYFEYRDRLNECCEEDKECGPKLGPFPIPVPPDCSVCNFDIKR